MNTIQITFRRWISLDSFVQTVCGKSRPTRVRGIRRWLLFGISALGTLGSLCAKSPPEPLTAEQFSEFRASLEQTFHHSISSRQNVEENVARFLSSAIEKRAAEYEGSITTISSQWASASMGTNVNFREEIKSVRFNINPPLKGMLVDEKPSAAEIDQKRGNPRRVVNHRPVVNQDQSVSFEITLVEPNATEQDVHIRFRGVVSYKYTGTAAIAAATNDLGVVIAHAEQLKDDSKGALNELVKTMSERIAAMEKDLTEEKLTQNSSVKSETGTTIDWAMIICSLIVAILGVIGAAITVLGVVIRVFPGVLGRFNFIPKQPKNSGGTNETK